MYLKPLELEGQQSVSVIPLVQVIVQIFDFGFQGDLFFVASLSLHSVNSPLKLLNSKVLHWFETTLYSLQSHKINPYILRYLYHLALKWSRIVFKYWASYKLYTNLTSHSMFFNATWSEIISIYYLMNAAYLIVYDFLLFEGICVHFGYLTVEVTNGSLASLKIKKNMTRQFNITYMYFTSTMYSLFDTNWFFSK